MTLQLETKRLLIRELRQTDISPIYQNMNDKRITKEYQVPTPFTSSNAVDLVNMSMEMAQEVPRTKYLGGIELKGNNNLIGEIELYTSLKQGEIRYWISPEHQRKGLASEATQAILNFAFNELNLSQIKAKISPKNKASKGLVTKLGFEFIGKDKEKKDVFTLDKKNYSNFSCTKDI